MTRRMSPVISNTSPLTNLAVIGRLDLVRTQLAGVAVPEAVPRGVNFALTPLSEPEPIWKRRAMVCSHLLGSIRKRAIPNFW